MTSKVTAPDGRIILVDHPEGMSDKEIIALARRQHPAGMAERASPTDPRIVTLSGSKYLAEGLKRRSGDIGAMAGAAVMPGTGLLGLGARLLGAEAGQDIGDVASGQKVTPGYGAATQLFGEGAIKAVSPLLSPLTYRAFANRTVKALAKTLKTLVPAWQGFPSTEKGLYEAVHGTGQRLLSRTFERAMQGIKSAVPETHVTQVPEMIETMGRMEMITKPRNTRALIDDLPTLRKTGGGPYRQALRALSEQLPEGLSPEIDAARAAYRNGAGFIEFAEKGKFLHGERYDPAKAHKALDQFGAKTLLGRGMDEVREIIRGPGTKPITPRTHGTMERRILGLMGGEAIGYPLGHPFLGPATGLAALEMLPETTYRNVPLGTAGKVAARLAPITTAGGLREAARELGVKEQLPGRVLTLTPGAGPSTAEIERQAKDRGLRLPPRALPPDQP